jgi:hypothetical protein
MNPARHTSPFFGVTPYFVRMEIIFLSYSALVPLNPLLSTTSIFTPNFSAIFRPLA